jgi:hypothetical protein
MQTNNNVHFFDLDGTLWKTDAMWWLIDKRNPSEPLLKITQEEGSLSVSGTFRKLGHEINYNGLTAWLSDNSYKFIKGKNIDLSNVGISYREFNDKKYLDLQAENLVIMAEHIRHLDNTSDTIALLTARGNKEEHDILLDKLRNKLTEHDLSINISKIYFVGDMSLSRHTGSSASKKAHVIAEHTVGFRIKDRQFVPIEQEKYKYVNFYDDEDANIDSVLDLNTLINLYLESTEDNLKEEIKSYLKSTSPVITTHKVHTNKENPFVTKSVSIVVADEPVKTP